MATDPKSDGPGETPADGERQFRLLADNAPVLIWRSGADKRCDFFNRPWLEFTGRTLEQELGFGWSEGVHPEDFERCLKTYDEAFDARRAFSMDYRLRRHDGAYRWMLENGRPYSTGRRFAGYFGSCVDITRRKEAEEEAKRGLGERERLHAELHHRVKNNMQLVVSLLGLQAAQETAPETRRKFDEMSMRVRSLALIQKQLYQSETVDLIDIGGYVRALAETLLPADPSNPARLTLEAADLDLPVDRATPIGLMINELIVNCRDHAFPDGRAGRVRVSVAETAPGRVRIVVADDGIGMAPETLAAAPSLGLKLVRILARQARAQVALEPGPGTTVVITFDR